MGNQVEVKNFTIINDSLQVSNKIVREYSLVNDYYTITSQESYAYDFNSKMLFKSSVSKTNYVGNEYRGFSYFNLNAPVILPTGTSINTSAYRMALRLMYASIGIGKLKNWCFVRIA